MRFIEEYYPSLLTVIITVIFYFQHIAINDIDNFEHILVGVITISSILIAFMGTTISILITLINSNVMKVIKDTNQGNKLSSFISRPIISGMILAIYCLLLYAFLDTSNRLTSEILFIIFIFLLSFFIFSSTRIYFLFINILRNVLNEKNSESGKIVKTKLNDVWEKNSE